MRSRDVPRSTAAKRVKRTLQTLHLLRSGLVEFRVSTTAQEQAVERFASRRLQLQPNVHWDIERMGQSTI